MHKLESFALSANAKIGSASIEESFFPIIEDKFICISTSSNESCKKYSYYDDVIFHIKPYLDKENIKIVQIGTSGDTQLFHCNPYFQTNRLHNSYIIGKSMMYVGNYNLYTNIASHKNKNIVCPINIDYVDSLFPYWSSKDNCKLIQHNPDNLKPFSLSDEPSRTIDKIKPEVIAAEVLNLLGINHNLDKIETIHIGSQYQNQVTEIVPFDDFNPNTQTGQVVTVRLDKGSSIKSLPAIAQNRKLNIVTNYVPDINILKALAESITGITYIVNNKTTKEDIDLLSSTGKPISLYSKDKKNISKIRLKFIDYDINLIEKLNKSNCNIKKITSDMRFLSRKNIVSNNQIFNSYLSLDKNNNTSKVEDSPLLWEDLSYIRIFKDKS